jgi:uncharacterized protein YbjT (DUF2867 family)
MILITGATGNIGSTLIQKFATTNIPVRALVRARRVGSPSSHYQAKQIAASNIEVVSGDFSEAESLISAMQGVKKLFLLSSLDPQMSQLQQQVINIAKQTDVEHIVKLSVENANPDSELTVMRWHGEVEQYLKASGLAWTNLRPGYFMQNLLMSATTIQTQNCFFTIHDEITAAIDTRDIAAVAFDVLTNSGHEQKNYHLTGAEILSYSQMLQQLELILGRKIQLIQLPQDNYRQGMIDAKIPEWLVNCLMEMATMPTSKPIIENTVSDILGRSPISFRQFAEDYAENFR